MRRMGLGSWLTLCAALFWCSCNEPSASDDAGVDAGARDPFRVGTWWVSPSELEALQQIVDAFRAANPDVVVELVALPQGGVERLAYLRENDWDIAQASLPSDTTGLLASDSGLTILALTDNTEIAPLVAQVDPEIAALLSRDGEIFGFPTNVHRENTMHYNIDLVPTPPTSVAELRAMCEAYVAGGSVGPQPVAIGFAGWILRIHLSGLLPPDIVSTTAVDPTAEITAALEMMEFFFDNDCYWIAPSEHGWDAAAQAVIDGQAMMYLHGDWAKGYMVQAGSVPGSDFGIAPGPGSANGYYFGVDTFVVNASSAQPELAAEFAQIALSQDVQIAFSEVKGSTPAVPVSDPTTIADPTLRSSYEQLAAARTANTLLPQPLWLLNASDTLQALLPDDVRPATVEARTAADLAAELIAAYQAQ